MINRILLMALASLVMGHNVQAKSSIKKTSADPAGQATSSSISHKSSTSKRANTAQQKTQTQPVVNQNDIRALSKRLEHAGSAVQNKSQVEHIKDLMNAYAEGRENNASGEEQQSVVGEDILACPNFEVEKIYPVSAFDGTNVCPSDDTRMLYVSTSGSDDNDGLSPETAFFTPKKAVDLAVSIRNGQAGTKDWVVLKRGDEWRGDDAPLGIIRPDRAEVGQSKTDRLVITAYGDGATEGLRPHLRGDGRTILNLWNNADAPDAGYLTVSGLKMSTAPGTGGTGFRLLYGYVKDIVIEDNEIRGFGVGIISQGGNLTDNPNAFFDKVLIQNNVIADTASSPGPGGHSQNAFISGTKSLIIRNNIIDHGGWAGSRDNGLDPTLIVRCNDNEGNRVTVDHNDVGYIDACPAESNPVFAGTESATIFNHNLYLQAGGFPALVVENIITRAASHGTQARSGGRIERNIYARNPLAAFVAGGALNPSYTNPPLNAYPVPLDSASSMINNVVLEGNDINTGLDRGFGFTHNGAYNNHMGGNLFANLIPTSGQYNNSAIDVLCGGGEYSTPEGCSGKVVNNVVYNWSSENGRGGALSFNLNQDFGPYRMKVSNNTFQKRAGHSGSSMVGFKGNRDSIYDAGNRVRFSNNSYIHSDIFTGDADNYQATGAQFALGGGEDPVNYSEWLNVFEDNAQGFTESSFTDPCRTLATYYDDVVLGNLDNDNCALMHDDDMFDDFMSLLKSSKNRFTPNPDLNSLAILNYIRAGFDMSQVETNVGDATGSDR